MTSPVREGRGEGFPYWRLSAFYFFYFATVGALLPYWAPYLKELGYAPARIGELIAILVGTKIFAPYIWGWIADHRGRRMAIVRLGSLVSVLCFALLWLGEGYLWLATVMLLFGFFWNATLPQFEATTLNHLGDSAAAYTKVRVWGSVGFILSVVLLGWILERHGLSLLPVSLLLLLLGIWVVSMAVPEKAAGHLPLDHGPLSRVLRRPEVAALLACCLLIQAAHGPYYAFFSIYLEEAGYGRESTGLLWALGVAAEVVLFLGMHRLLPVIGAGRLITWSLLLSVLRWMVIGWFVDSLILLMLAQLLHAATFGAFHAGAIQLFHRWFTGPHQGRGQALYSSMSFGVGGALGTLMSGYGWESLGGALTFTLAALLSAVAAVVSRRWIPLR